MDRRKSIKAMILGTVSTAVLVEACKSSATTVAEVNMDDRMQEEKDYLVKVKAQPNFFTEHEMATITLLSDIIIPKDANGKLYFVQPSEAIAPGSSIS